MIEEHQSCFFLYYHKQFLKFKMEKVIEINLSRVGVDKICPLSGYFNTRYNHKLENYKTSKIELFCNKYFEMFSK